MRSGDKITKTHPENVCERLRHREGSVGAETTSYNSLFLVRQLKAYEYFSCSIPSRDEDRTCGKLASADTYARVVKCGRAEMRVRWAALTNEFGSNSQRALSNWSCWRRWESLASRVRGGGCRGNFRGQ